MAKRIHSKKIPVYTTFGEFSAFMMYPFLFDPQGEWIGWISKDRSVFSVAGLYAGWLIDGPRVVRKRVNGSVPVTVPISPPSIRPHPPATIPLPPLMSELPWNLIDVLDEQPERLHTTDAGISKADMD